MELPRIGDGNSSASSFTLVDHMKNVISNQREHAGTGKDGNHNDEDLSDYEGDSHATSSTLPDRVDTNTPKFHAGIVKGIKDDNEEDKENSSSSTLSDRVDTNTLKFHVGVGKGIKDDDEDNQENSSSSTLSDRVETMHCKVLHYLGSKNTLKCHVTGMKDDEISNATSSTLSDRLETVNCKVHGFHAFNGFHDPKNALKCRTGVGMVMKDDDEDSISTFSTLSDRVETEFSNLLVSHLPEYAVVRGGSASDGDNSTATSTPLERWRMKMDDDMRREETQQRIVRRLERSFNQSQEEEYGDLEIDWTELDKAYLTHSDDQSTLAEATKWEWESQRDRGELEEIVKFGGSPVAGAVKVTDKQIINQRKGAIDVYYAKSYWVPKRKVSSPARFTYRELEIVRKWQSVMSEDSLSDEEECDLMDHLREQEDLEIEEIISLEKSETFSVEEAVHSEVYGDVDFEIVRTVRSVMLGDRLSDEEECDIMGRLREQEDREIEEIISLEKSETFFVEEEVISLEKSETFSVEEAVHSQVYGAFDFASSVRKLEKEISGGIYKECDQEILSNLSFATFDSTSTSKSASEKEGNTIDALLQSHANLHPLTDGSVCSAASQSCDFSLIWQVSQNTIDATSASDALSVENNSCITPQSNWMKTTTPRFPEQSQKAPDRREMRDLLMSYVCRGHQPPSLEKYEQWRTKMEKFDEMSDAEVAAEFKRSFGRGSQFVYDKINRKWVADLVQLVPLVDCFKEEFLVASKRAAEAHANFVLLQRVQRTSFEATKRVLRGKMSSIDAAVATVYKYLHHQSNKYLGANFSSTYAEVTKKSMENLISTIIQERMLPPDGVICDLGAGYNIPMAHLAQRIPDATVVGIEYCPLRAYGFVKCYMSALEEKEDFCFVNNKIAYILGNIFHVDSLEWCDVVYQFDEAFPENLCQHIWRLFRESSRPQYLIAYKTGRASDGRKELDNALMQTAGVERMFSKRTFKTGSHEGGLAVFYRRIKKQEGVSKKEGISKKEGRERRTRGNRDNAARGKESCATLNIPAAIKAFCTESREFHVQSVNILLRQVEEAIESQKKRKKGR